MDATTLPITHTKITRIVLWTTFGKGFWGISRHFLISRLFVWVSWKVIVDKMKATIVAYAVIFPFIFIVPAFGAADGGPIAWKAGLIYIPFGIFFLAIDILRAKGKSS